MTHLLIQSILKYISFFLIRSFCPVSVDKWVSLLRVDMLLFGVGRSSCGELPGYPIGTVFLVFLSGDQDVFEKVFVVCHSTASLPC
jgi:hypothetical protein